MSSTMPVESSINNSSNNSNKPSACIDIKNHSNLEVRDQTQPYSPYCSFVTSPQFQPIISGKTPWNSAEVKRFGFWRR